MIIIKSRVTCGYDHLSRSQPFWAILRTISYDQVWTFNFISVIMFKRNRLKYFFRNLSLQLDASQHFLASFFLYVECLDCLLLAIMTLFQVAWSGFDSFKTEIRLHNGPLINGTNESSPWKMLTFKIWFNVKRIKSVMVSAYDRLMFSCLWSLEFLCLLKARNQNTKKKI